MMVDLTPFKEGIKRAREKAPEICRDPRSAFLSVLDAEGFKSPSSLKMGVIDRIDGVEDKRGKRSGWYIYTEIDDTHEDGHVIGIASYGDWKLGTSETWTSRSEHKMSTQERTRYHEQREAMRIKREEEEHENQKEAAALAYEIWDNMEDAKDHEYLKKKGVKTCEGLKIAKGLKKYDMEYHNDKLIVPVAVEGQITSLQFIDKDSGKFFLSGGKLKGGWFMIEGDSQTVYIAEGYSTAASIHEATGATTYIAFNAGNLYEVSAYVKNKHTESRIIIAGDDDTETAANIGRTKAEQVAQGLNIDCIFPDGFNDFNDMHCEIGIKFLTKHLQPSNIEIYQQPSEKDEKFVCRPQGVLGNIVDYYNATSGGKLPEFAIQTALSIGAVVLGRNYKSNFNNYTHLYLVNIAQSATGKEHAKTIAEKILYQSGQSQLVGGDGYTSAGAVYSALIAKPRHLSCIDEFGRYLEAGRDIKGGNHHQREANTKLMEAFGRGHSVMRPANYSTMTMKKNEKSEIENRRIYNPSITILGTTTPSTFFEVIDINAVKDGFLNRFIVSISKAKRSIRKHMPDIDVPETIIEWVNQINQRASEAGCNLSSSDPANPIILDFDQASLTMQEAFQQECIDKADELEIYGLSELPMRSAEKAMKISLIAALSRNPHATVIEAQDMEWAINYIRQCDNDIISALKNVISRSPFEAHKKEILVDLRKRQADGVTKAQMQTE
ncbi:MAG: DUF3987 domain-containing protein, partial [Pseudomonadota bacterium]